MKTLEEIKKSLQNQKPKLAEKYKVKEICIFGSYSVEETPDDFDFQLPNFSSPEEAKLWLDSLPHEDAEVDERLTKKIPITINFHQLMVDGFDYLAKLKGVGDGKDLMYMVLNQYLNDNLPDEF